MISKSASDVFSADRTDCQAQELVEHHSVMITPFVGQ